ISTNAKYKQSPPATTSTNRSHSGAANTPRNVRYRANQFPHRRSKSARSACTSADTSTRNPSNPPPPPTPTPPPPPPTQPPPPPPHPHPAPPPPSPPPAPPPPRPPAGPPAGPRECQLPGCFNSRPGVRSAAGSIRPIAVYRSGSNTPTRTPRSNSHHPPTLG